MKYGPYATPSHAFQGAAVELDYVYRGIAAWRKAQPTSSTTDDLINSFAAQFGVVLEQQGRKWFWSAADEAVNSPA